MKKQAILIMYHEDYNLLIKKLELLDHKNIDIYLHIDKKAKNFDYEKTSSILKQGKLYYTKRLDVRWGTYSQIKCELLLFETAYNNYKYKYFHLISGIDMPLKKVDEIYNFFDKNYPSEFVAYVDFDNTPEYLIERIRYYHIFNAGLRNKYKFIEKISDKLYYNTLKVEKKLHIDRLKNNKLAIRKGANWVSITDKCVKYILDNKKIIKKMFSHSYCADELFIQTLVYNSKFKDKIYRKYKGQEHHNTFRLIDWDRGSPYTFRSIDYKMLKETNCFFARKFSTKVDSKIIDKIYNELK